MANEKKIPLSANFLISAGAGCGAAFFTQPIDVVKNRMQMSGAGGGKKDHKSSLHAIMHIVKNEGPIALLDGLTANFARQVFYTGTRLVTFQSVRNQLAQNGYQGTLPLVGSGLTAGFIASIIACPTDVALVRMTSDRRLPEAERRKYKHFVDAVSRIAKEEGVLTLWTGVVPTVVRAMVGNVAQLVTYSRAKEYILANDLIKDGIGCHFAASMVSGFVYAFSSNPMDVAKTRMQNMRTMNGKPEYSGMLDVWYKTLKTEGFTALWKGFGPYYFRIGPNTVFLFIFNEQLIHAYKKYVLKDTSAKGGF